MVVFCSLKEDQRIRGTESRGFFFFWFGLFLFLFLFQNQNENQIKIISFLFTTRSFFFFFFTSSKSENTHQTLTGDLGGHLGRVTQPTLGGKYRGEGVGEEEEMGGGRV